MEHYKLDVTMVCAGMGMDGDTIPSGKSLGGSETAAVQLAEALARQRHHVTMFCNTEKLHEKNGVCYMPLGWVKNRDGSMFPKSFMDYSRSTPVDVIVVQRLPAFFGFEYQSKVNFLWQHDLATKTGPSMFHPVMWNLDRIFVLSDFMKTQYQSVHGGPNRLYHVTRNGIDLDLLDSSIKDIGEDERDRFQITYTGRPERGLNHLLQEVFPEILKREPRAKLYVSRYDDPAMLPLYQEMEQLMKRFGDRVVNLGHLGKQDLYKHYKRSRLYVYPSPFEEVSCITVNEVGAAGGVLVGPWRAALPETCDGRHVLIKDDGTMGREGDPIDPGFKGISREFVQSFADQAVDLMHDDERWTRLSKAARERAEKWTWDPIAEQWMELAHKIIAEKSSEPRRMFKHFIMNSDVVAAKEYARRNPELQKPLDTYIDRFVPFMKIDDGEERRKAIGDFYEQRSGGERANYQVAFWADTEPRLKVLLEWMREKPEIKTVLDFGCAHGGYARAISNEFPDVKVVGVDVSPSLIRCSNELREAKMPDGTPACNHQNNLSFMVGDEDSKLFLHPNGHYSSLGLWGDATYESGTEEATFDLVLGMDLLEHLPHAEEVAEKLERHCKPDGYMLFTVPYGHKERDEYVNKQVPPVHVRSFDLHDLRDLFGKRKGFSVQSFSDFQELELDRSFASWFMVSYRKDDKRIGRIDWDRKCFLQGPRETLAVCMITHNSEEVLHRCLRSVQKIADQIVILDNGPSEDRTVQVASEYTPDVRAGTSPFYCYTHMQNHPEMVTQPGVCEMAGFETPRNESIDNVWADWIWWIDYDEQLLDGAKMLKYLRQNIYLGYAINQHHLSVDPPGSLKRDIPVRLFRNKAGMKFYGLVHEHAELAPNKGIGPNTAVLTDVNISHDGYLTEGIRRGRFNRNLKLLECDRKKYPDRLLGIYLYDVRDNVHMARYALERSNGQVTPEIERHCWTVINSFRKYFMGKDVILAKEGLLYYSDAMAILGIGVEVAAAIDVKRSGANITNDTQVHFRATDQAEINHILSAKVRELCGPFEGPYVS